ncbi:MAG: Abi family protein [Acidobacteria bacterium]|nr:Abi family protein [Acidobacteriota bacterium]
MKFTKPPLSFQAQLALLKRRGMAIDDEAKALGCLGHLNYYRLRAYWIHMEGEKDLTTGDHCFKPGTSFEDALALYVFDRKLRLLVMDAIERVEVSVRTRWANHLALTYGPHAHLEPARFRSAVQHSRSLDDLNKEISRSTETFIEHLIRTYDEPPPIWAACEVMSFGQLSRWVGNLKFRQDRKAIALAYGLDAGVLVSFLHHLTTVRNLCAHHNRLWNRRFTVTMQIPQSLSRVHAGSFNPAADRNLANTLAMLAWVLRSASPDSAWSRRVKELILATPQVDPAAMGFAAGWHALSLWT